MVGAGSRGDHEGENLLVARVGNSMFDLTLFYLFLFLSFFLFFIFMFDLTLTVFQKPKK